MTDSTPIVTSNWQIESLEDFKTANPHLNNHSSRLIVDPREPVVLHPVPESSD